MRINLITRTFWALILSLSLGLGLGSVAAAADADDPKQVLRTSIDQLLQRFTTERAALEADSDKLYALAEELTGSGWSFEKMARLVLGKNWRNITEAQQKAFTAEFKQLLIRTYASAMFKYTGKEAITFGETEYKGEGNTRAKVNANGSLGDGSPTIPLTFSYFKDDQGSWNIYNIAVDGVSLVTVYRVSYNNFIASKGMDALIDSLREKNAG